MDSSSQNPDSNVSSAPLPAQDLPMAGMPVAGQSVPPAAPVVQAPTMPPVATMQSSPMLSGSVIGNFNNVKAAANVGLALGVLLIVVSIVLFLFVDVAYIINLPFAVVALFFAWRLRNALAVGKAVVAIKVLYITVVVMAVLSLVTAGRGVGLVPILLVYYLNKSLGDLFDAGLITSKVPFQAKAKV